MYNCSIVIAILLLLTRTLSNRVQHYQTGTSRVQVYVDAVLEPGRSPRINQLSIASTQNHMRLAMNVGMTIDGIDGPVAFVP